MRGKTLRPGDRTMCEGLESRRLLSGNVTVALVGTTLTINGDNKSNQIDVEAGTAFAGYTVTGTGGTKINGLASKFIATPGPFDVTIDMGNGDDAVRMFPAPGIPFDAIALKVDMGNGSDGLELNNWACDSLQVDMGNGGDEVKLTDTTVENSFLIDLGNGSDKVTLVGKINIGGPATIVGGNGPDTVDGLGIDFGASNFAILLDGVETLLTV